MSCNHNWNIKKQGQITKQLISSPVLVKSYVGFSVMEKSPFPGARLELSGQLLENPIPGGHLEHHDCKHKERWSQVRLDGSRQSAITRALSHALVPWQLHCCKPGPALSYLTTSSCLPAPPGRWNGRGHGARQELDPRPWWGKWRGQRSKRAFWGLWVGKPTSRLQWQLSAWSPQKPWLRPWDTASFWGWRHFHQASSTSFCVMQFSCYLGLSSHVHDFLWN